MELRILTPSEDRPRLQHRIEELYGCHMEMRGVAPWKEVQCSRIGRARIDRTWAHGKPDRRRCQLLTVILRVGEVCQSSPAKARRLDRIRNFIFYGCNANAEGENAGRTSRSPILIGPVSRCHLRENEERRDALVVHRRLERCIL